MVALALLAGSLFYLDNFRVRLIEERRAQAETAATIAAAALAAAPRRARPALIATLGKRSGNRLRLFDERGRQLLDSWQEGARTYGFDGRADEPWDTPWARRVDRVVERLAGAQTPPPFVDYGRDGRRWPEVQSVMADSTVSSRVRLAPDRTLLISAATAVDAQRALYLLAVDNVRDVTRAVRAERFRLTIILSATLALSILLSLFLARTIVQPLRRLAVAAQRVRLGRDREVVVPRLPQRSDEIGQLARAVSDMSQALRERIDATEAFAADVAHELKNPLASMASAVQSLGRTDDPALTAQLRAILVDDVRRLDRAITEIAELSRVDAELSRAAFEPVDVAALLAGVADAHQRRGVGAVRFVPPPPLPPALGDPRRLERAIDNLLANALSFSPPGAGVALSAEAAAGEIRVIVDDAGPGVPLDKREAIFARFHSERPEGGARHSGLGLAIARAIAVAHHGALAVEDGSALGGARFVLRLPAA